MYTKVKDYKENKNKSCKEMDCIDCPFYLSILCDVASHRNSLTFEETLNLIKEELKEYDPEV